MIKKQKAKTLPENAFYYFHHFITAIKLVVLCSFTKSASPFSLAGRRRVFISFSMRIQIIKLAAQPKRS